MSEVHVMLPYLYKALQLAVSERDQQELADTLLQCAELLGRFVLPSTYVPLFTPRLREEAIETPHGVSEGNKVAVLGVLRAMLEGSQPAEVVQQAQVPAASHFMSRSRVEALNQSWSWLLWCRCWWRC